MLHNKLEGNAAQVGQVLYGISLIFVYFQGTVQVIIYVTDENDNAPVFKPASYSVTLREGAATKAITIVDVNATDQDEGSNKQLVFSIISGNLRNVFFINNETVRNYHWMS